MYSQDFRWHNSDGVLFYFYTLLVTKIRFEHKQKSFNKNFKDASDTLYYRIDI